MNEKPKLEEIAPDYLDGEALSNLLDFAAWLRANKMTPTFGSRSKVGISYTTRVLYVKLFHSEWYIWISGKAKSGKYIEEFLACEELKDIVGRDLALCIPGCGHKCNNGQGYTVFVCGEKFERICGCCTVRFRSPSSGTISVIKKVIEARNNRRD